MTSKPGAPVSVIVGLGETGLSVAKYFARTGEAFKVVDSRENPPGLEQLQQLYPQADVELGEFKLATFLAARQLVVSPGVSLKTDAIAAARRAGVVITGDIDIFSKQVTAPIIAVTGSNGKSTVVAIVAEILRMAGVQFGLGGNLDGANFKPALDLLQEAAKEMYVLELSSFQLETTERLGAAIAVILNVSPDHMDRYANLDEYSKAKQRIFNGCKQVLVNRDDASGNPPLGLDLPIWSFGLGKPAGSETGIIDAAGQDYLATDSEKMVAVQDLNLVGQHNIANALAAMALTLAVGIDTKSIANAVRGFAGLPHRCQWVANINGIAFYNDSKGTNVGATMAAIEGLGQRLTGQIVLIAGGVGKDADFSMLVPVVKKWVKAVVLIGQDAKKIADQFDSDMQIEFASDMPQAVSSALRRAAKGDAVLLSPACASFDMFDNFQHRGQIFMNTVESMR